MVSSLAKSYDYFENKKRIKKYGRDSSHSKSAIAGVEEKIEEASKKDKNFLAALIQKTAADSHQAVGPPQVGTLTGQSAPRDPSTDEASAVTTGVSIEVQKKDLAVALIDARKLWVYFSGMVLDDAYEAVVEGVSEGEMDFTHSREVSRAVGRSESRFNDICDLPLKLVLIPLHRGRKVANVFASLLEMRFGPMHAALQVGNVVLEWNDSSLVTPHLCAYEDQVMEVNVQPHSKWVEYTAQHRPQMQRAAQTLDFSEQIELTYKITSQKKVLIDALIQLIIKYNKGYYYNLFDRNCQHFVLDALKVLEVDIPEQLPGGLGEYYKALVKGKTPSVPDEFKTHSDLDRYVTCKVAEKAIDGMPQHDLEFLLALYFRFHLESRAKLKDSRALEAWQCGEDQCRIEEVQRRIRMEEMKIHSFQQTQPCCV
jgi:hypothetical protein